MLRIYVGLCIAWSVFMTMFVSVSSSAETAVEETWQDVDYKDFKSCPSGEMVVGMCRSGRKKTCNTSHAGATKTAHKIKCRKFDTKVYEHSSQRETVNAVKFSLQPDATMCATDSFIGGFCVSGLIADCGKRHQLINGVWNKMECRGGFRADAETRDICANFGQDIACPKDDEGGAWAAVGMCSGKSDSSCNHLQCYSKGNTAYGLRCARLKKEAPRPSLTRAPRRPILASIRSRMITYKAKWLDMDYREVMSCRPEEMVVGMCRSGSTETCEASHGGETKTAHKIKCRKFNTKVYQHSNITEKYGIGIRFSPQNNTAMCNAHNFIAGFCVSGGEAECRLVPRAPSVEFNLMFCRGGFSVDAVDETKDVCANFGEDIACPEDDEGGGAWAAVGMCNGQSGSSCNHLQCFKEGTTAYGLRCARLKKEAPRPSILRPPRRPILASIRSGEITYEGTWMDMDYKRHKSCRYDGMVVGMCRSGQFKTCEASHGGETKTAHKIKCRKFDRKFYYLSDNAQDSVMPVSISKQPEFKICDSHGFISSFCVSGGISDCGFGNNSIWSMMSCQTGYTADKVYDTVDICANFGEDIACPEDDEGGSAWAAIGMCTDNTGSSCSHLQCFKEGTTVYGLRCARLKKAARWSKPALPPGLPASVATDQHSSLAPSILFSDGSADVALDKTWSPMNYGDFKSCPSNERVVGICRSGPTMECKNGDGNTAHKIKCRPLDPELYRSTTNPPKVEEHEVIPPPTIETDAAGTQEGSSPLPSKMPVQTCSASNMLIAGFCVSGGTQDCKSLKGDQTSDIKVWNRMECQSGYEHNSNTVIETKDVCGTFGQDIECPEDDDVGVWAATGMCSGDSKASCLGLNCESSKKTYGLQCVKIKRKAPPTPIQPQESDEESEKENETLGETERSASTPLSPATQENSAEISPENSPLPASNSVVNPPSLTSGSSSGVTNTISDSETTDGNENPSPSLPSLASEAEDPISDNEQPDGNEVAGIASLSSGSGGAKATSDDEVALLVAQLMKEKDSNGSDTKASCGLLFLMTTMMLLLIH